MGEPTELSVLFMIMNIWVMDCGKSVLKDHLDCKQAKLYRHTLMQFQRPEKELKY